jgi:hypothetical protein
MSCSTTWKPIDSQSFQVEGLFGIMSNDQVILCLVQWLRQQGNHSTSSRPSITSKQIEAFDTLYVRGILAAARNEVLQQHNTWPLEHDISITSG